VGWLRDNGSHPYILLDDAERDSFARKFSRRSAAGRLDIAPVFEYRDRYGMSTFLYDPLQASTSSRAPVIVMAPRSERVTACVPPGTLSPSFPFR
jgi:hypothetical protein